MFRATLLGEFIALEDKEQEDQKKGKRTIREEDEADNSSGEEQRVDMSAITGAKEREDRREQFYSSHPQASDDDSDVEMDEWENQQIRKGVTGAQILSAQKDSAFKQYITQPFSKGFNTKDSEEKQLTTAELLEQAYSQTNFEVAKSLKKEKKKEDAKPQGIKTPQEILKSINDKLRASREQNHKNFLEVDRITEEFGAIQVDLQDCIKNGPVAAAKYRFYQELKLYMDDLIECLNEKLPVITALEDKAMSVMGKYSKKLIERRRQDVRDQAKELTDTSKNLKASNPLQVSRKCFFQNLSTKRRQKRRKEYAGQLNVKADERDEDAIVKSST